MQKVSVTNAKHSSNNQEIQTSNIIRPHLRLQAVLQLLDGLCGRALLEMRLALDVIQLILCSGREASTGNMSNTFSTFLRLF